MSLNHTQNSTQDDSSSTLVSFKVQVISINIPFLFVLGLITVVTNGLLLWVMTTDPLRTLHRPKILIDFWMTVVQFLAGILLLPVVLANEILNGLYNKNYEWLSTITLIMTRWIIGLGGIFIIITILEGTGGITNPHLVRRMTTKRNVLTAVLFCFGITFIYSMLLVLGVPEQVHSVVFVHLFVLLPIVLSVVLFVRAYKRIKNPKTVAPTTRITLNEYNKEKLKMNRIRNEKVARNFIKTIAVFFSPFLLSFLSYYIFIIFKRFYIDGKCRDSRWCIVHRNLMLSLLYIHFAFTPLAVMYKILEYRNAVSYCLRKMLAKLCPS